MLRLACGAGQQRPNSPSSAADSAAEGDDGNALGRVLLTSCKGCVVQEWSLDTGERLRELECEGEIWALLSLDQDRFATGCEDGKVRVWRTQSGESVCALEGHVLPVTRLVALEDGLLASASRDRSVRLWCPQTWACLGVLQGHRGAILAMAPLGFGLLATGSEDKTVRIWASQSRKHLCTLKGHGEAVSALAMLWHGRLASGDASGQVRVWAPESGELIHILAGHTGQVWDLASIDEGAFASACKRRVCIWNPATGAELHRHALGLRMWERPCRLVALGRLGFAAAEGLRILLFGPSGELRRQMGEHAVWGLRNPINAIASPLDAGLQELQKEGKQQLEDVLANEHLDLGAAARLLQWRSRPELLQELERRASAQASHTLLYCTSFCTPSVYMDFESNLFFREFHPELLKKAHSPQGWGDGGDFAPRATRAVEEQCLREEHCLRSRTGARIRCCSSAIVAPLWFFAGFLGHEDLLGLADEPTQTCLRTLATSRLAWAAESRRVLHLRYALVLAKHVGVQGSPESLRAQAALSEAEGFLPFWDVASMIRQAGDRLAAKIAVPHGDARWDAVQQLLSATFVDSGSAVAGGGVAMQMGQHHTGRGLKLHQLFSIQNELPWGEYRERQRRLRSRGEKGNPEPFGSLATEHLAADGLEELEREDLLERWLWHGTSHASAEKIVFEDFKVDMAGTHRGTIYGNGVYLSEFSARADFYSERGPAGTFAMLLCRVTLGRVLRVQQAFPDPGRIWKEFQKGGYDSVLGDRAGQSVPREFVVYDPAAVYPAYLLVYKRLQK